MNNLKLVLFALMFMLFTVDCFCQIGSKPIPNDQLGEIYSFAFRNDGYLYAGGSTMPGFLVSSNKGDTWSLVDEGIYNSIIYYYFTQKFLYVIDINGSLHQLSKNGGLKRITPESDNDYVTVFLADSNADIYYGTDNGYLYKSIDNGATFTELFYQDNTSGIGCFFIYNNDMYLGVGGKGIFKSIDQGSTWQEFTDGVDSKNAVKFVINPNDTNLYFIDRYSGLYKLSEDGSQWTVVDNIHCQYLLTDLIVSKGSMYLSTENKGIFKSLDNGISWQQLAVGLINSSITIAADSSGVLFTSDMVNCYKSTNNGDEWICFTNSNQKTTVNTILTDAKGSIYCTINNDIYYSTDSGNNWKIISRPDNNTNFTNLKIINDTILCIIYQENDELYYSSNKGEEWNQVNFEDNNFKYLVDICSGKNKDIFILSAFSVFASTDLSINQKKLSNVGKYYILNDSIEIATLGLNINSKNEIYIFHELSIVTKSTDLGQTWNLLKSINSFDDYVPSVIKLEFNSKNEIYYLDTDGFLFKSVDDFKTSINLNKAFLDASDGISSFVINSKDYIFIGTNFGKIYYTVDGGINWELFNSPLSVKKTYDTPLSIEKRIYSLGLDKNENLIVGTDKGILKTNLSTTDPETELNIETDTDLSNITISPNPASDFIEISDINPMLKHGVEYSNIRIFNVFGQNVSSTWAGLEPAPTIRIDVSGLAPGMYFVRIGDRDQKFIKI